MPSLNEITQVFHSGKADYERLQEAIEMCIDGCHKMSAVMKSAITPKVGSNK
jgi:ribonuclease PH